MTGWEEHAMKEKQKMVDEPRNIYRKVLPNGLTVLTETMPHIRSVSIGIWVRTGSRHEEPEANGVSHFLEHMVFKGTKSRSAEQIARQVDSIGGKKDGFHPQQRIFFLSKVSYYTTSPFHVVVRPSVAVAL